LKEFAQISGDDFSINYRPVKSNYSTEDKPILAGGTLEIWFSKNSDGSKAKEKAVLIIATGEAGYQFEVNGFPNPISSYDYNYDLDRAEGSYIKNVKIPLEQISKDKIDEYAKHVINQYTVSF